MKKWWEEIQANRPYDYHAYNVGDTEVIISGRRDVGGMDNDFFKSIDGFLVVTESYIEYPITANVRWFPWCETIENFPSTTLYGSLKILNYWINELKLKRIVISCDGGTHRAPSTFGAFIYAYHQKDTKKILNSIHYGIENSYYQNKKDPTKCHSNPVEYFADKMRSDKNLKYLLRHIVKYPNDDLETCIKNYRAMLPYGLKSNEEKKAFDDEKNKNDFYVFAKRELKKIGYDFPHHDYSEFSVRKPNGEEAMIWICAVPFESYHGILGLDLRKHPSVEIYSPLGSEDYQVREDMIDKVVVEKKESKLMNITVIRLK